MTTEYIIMDASVKYMNARNILEEGLFYVKENDWCRKLANACKFTEVNDATNIAKELNKVLPVRVLVIQAEGERIGVGEIKL